MKQRSVVFGLLGGVIALMIIAFAFGPRDYAKADSPIRYAALGYQQITSMDTAVGLTVPAGATSAVITAEAQAIRWRDDGTAPTATVGMPVAVNVPFNYSGPLANMKVISQTAGAKLNVAYYQ